jgi:serine/threonine-protein kinase
VYGVAGFERQFAIKRFHARLAAEPDRAAQLANAARLYGALEHPRIARMHEFGVAAGETFTATELVRGVDLAQLVQATHSAGRPLPSGAAVALLSAAARAVGFAHGRGLSHLGICPTNVLCTAEGDVKITDFGFLPLRLPARPADDPSLLARLPYLAPEQHRGETGTPATDVFQLGLLAWELLTGEPALAAPSPAGIELRALAGDLPPLDLPKPLTAALRRAMARSPYERFPDAGALADALDAALRTAPLPGDRRDLAGIVRSALEHQAQMNENQLSGALRLPVPAPPRDTPSGALPVAAAVVRRPAEPPRPTSHTPVPQPEAPERAGGAESLAPPRSGGANRWPPIVTPPALRPTTRPIMPPAGEPKSDARVRRVQTVPRLA